MWVFCSAGFFSAVEVREDRTKVMVRGRWREDLEQLARGLERVMPTPRQVPGPVLYTPRADYPYRVVCSKEAWARFLAREARAINYDNFKAAVLPGDEPGRDQAYHACWAALRRAQPRHVARGARGEIFAARGREG